MNYKYYRCDIYYMNYISQSFIHSSKFLLNCVIKSTNIPEKKVFIYIFDDNCSSLEQRYKTLVTWFNKPKGKKKFTFPVFDNKYLSSSKTLSIGPKYFFFFQLNIMTYVIQCPVFHVCWFDTWLHNYKFIQGYKKITNKGSVFFQKKIW